MESVRRDSLTSDAEAFQDAITDLIRVYQFRDRDAVCCHDVSLGQSHALERLARLGPMSLNDFAAALYLEKSSASRLVDGLERKGLLSRSPDPEDGRYVQLALTERGRKLTQRIRRDLIGERVEILRRLAPAERKVVVEAIARLAEVAASRVEAGHGSCARL